MVKRKSQREIGVRLSLRIGPRNAKQLAELSRATGLSQSKLVDMLIQRCGRELEDALTGALKPKE